MSKEHYYTIGDAAKASDLRVEAIRYYEKEGLLKSPRRTAAGYRLYTEESIKRLIFISTAKELGFSLKDIKGLLSLRANPKSRCKDVRQKAEDKIREVDEKIKTLREIKKALKSLSAQCSGRGLATDCPILESIEKTSSEKLYG